MSEEVSMDRSNLLPLALSVLVMAGCTPPAVPGPGGTSGAATGSPVAGAALELQYPAEIAVDASGNLYVADRWGQRIDRISPTGQATTIAKTIYGDWQDGAKAMELPIGQIGGLAVGDDGSVYVASSTALRVIRIDRSGQVTSVVSGDAATGVQDLALDRNGDFILLDVTGRHLLRATKAGGRPTPILADDAPVRQNSLTLPAWTRFSHVAVDPQGRLVLSESSQHRILRLDADGHLESIAGTGLPGFSGSGRSTETTLNAPGALAIGDDGTIYLADVENRRVLRLSPDGTFVTVAGTEKSPAIYPNNGDDGPATQARLVNLADVALDRQGNLYISDSYLRQVRKVDRQGTITRVAGKASEASAQPPYGTATLALEAADREAAGRLAQALLAFDDRIAESNAWYGKLIESKGLEALITGGPGFGIYEQTNGSKTETDGSITRTLTTRRQDKVQAIVETLTRTDGADGTLSRFSINRHSRSAGPDGSRSLLVEDESLRWMRFGLTSTMTLLQYDPRGESDWQLTATRGPGISDAPAGSGAITTYSGKQIRRFTFKWDSQYAPHLTVAEEGGTLQVTGTYGGDDNRLQSLSFQSGTTPAGEIRIR
jgi:sugar lactone lactonase YvrE